MEKIENEKDGGKKKNEDGYIGIAERIALMRDIDLSGNFAGDVKKMAEETCIYLKKCGLEKLDKEEISQYCAVYIKSGKNLLISKIIDGKLGESISGENGVEVIGNDIRKEIEKVFIYESERGKFLVKGITGIYGYAEKDSLLVMVEKDNRRYWTVYYFASIEGKTKEQIKDIHVRFENGVNRDSLEICTEGLFFIYLLERKMREERGGLEVRNKMKDIKKVVRIGGRYRKVRKAWIERKIGYKK